jgi:hypothetical protein
LAPIRSPTADLVAFLTARLDETQDDAERGYLKAEPIPGCDGWDQSGTAGLPPAVAARVLRDVAAKRAILAEHAPDYGECRVCADHDGEMWLSTGDVMERRTELEAPCPTVRHLAAEHSDHPDYKATWRP